jgi:predicted CoA-binding protein
MTQEQTIVEIFKKYRTIAVLGMSSNIEKPSNFVPGFLKSVGYEIIPINPIKDYILDLKCYKNLDEITDKIDILNVFRPSEEALLIVKTAIKRKKEKGDISVIWLQEGIKDDNAKTISEENGIIFVQDRCMFKEYKSL